jgi:hypothetical protein
MITDMRTRVAGVLVVAAAACAAIVPSQAAWVERYYARGWYPVIQRGVTATSNAVPFALLDLLIVAGLAVGVLAAASVFRASRGARWRMLARRAWQSVIVAALVYLTFLGTWGCNYQREPVSAWLDFDQSRVTTAAVLELNENAVGEMGRLRPLLPENLEAWPARDRVARGLLPALQQGTRVLHLPAPVRAGRPKLSILDPYFTRAGVSGMTDPFFLETLLPSNLLPFEQPAVIAHEWGHLAGLARESDASFFGLVVCFRGDDAAQYSAWLEIFLQTLAARDREGRQEIRARLPALVRADLEAMTRRSERDQISAVSFAAWRVYDGYLRSNRVTSGVRNYGEVVRLMVGTRFASGWTPVVRPQD